MCKYIDLSHTIDNELITHPYDDKIKLYRNKFLDKDKYNDSKLETGMHVGTHIDVASHIMESNILICDYPINKFIGKGCLLDVRNETVIKMKEEYLGVVEENDIVLLYTGFDKKFKNDYYFTNHPIVEKELAKFFIEKKIKLVGMDLPSPDKYPFEIHKILLEKDILIIENLKNLERLINIDKFEIAAFPLKIKAEASPVRVVAMICR